MVPQLVAKGPVHIMMSKSTPVTATMHQHYTHIPRRLLARGSLTPRTDLSLLPPENKPISTHSTTMQKQEDYWHNIAVMLAQKDWCWDRVGPTILSILGISLGMRPANERRRYIETTSLIG